MLAFVLYDHFQQDHNGRAEDISDLAQGERTAVIATKEAFVAAYGNAPFRASTVNTVRDPAPPIRGGARPILPPIAGPTGVPAPIVDSGPVAPGFSGPVAPPSLAPRGGFGPAAGGFGPPRRMPAGAGPPGLGAPQSGEPPAVAPPQHTGPPGFGTRPPGFGMPRSGRPGPGRRFGPRRFGSGKPAEGAGADSSGSAGARTDLASAAIGYWRAVTALPSAPPAAWRRLGVTLFLFGKPGGMAALDRATQPSARPAGGSPPRAKSAARRRLVEHAPLPAVDERALWQTLYGPTGPQAADVPALRVKLAKLELGWFEDVAAAQLYERAGMHADAVRAVGRARSSAAAMGAVIGFDVLLAGSGLILLLGGFVVWLVRLASAQGARPSTGRDGAQWTVSESYLQPQSGMMLPLVGRVEEGRRQGLMAGAFSQRARLAAFAVYYGSFLLVGWALQFALPLIARLSETEALRATLLIDLLAYAPVVAAALFALKRLGENEAGRPIGWRDTLAALGFRTDAVGRDVSTAVIGYAMLTPILLVAMEISYRLFKNFHTPVHGVELIILDTEDLPVRMLLAFQAVVAAPIVEEMMFRGVLFPGLRQRWGLVGGAALSAALFALSHNTLPGGFLQLWSLGFAFALVANRNRSILPNILMHGIHNGLVTALMFTVFSR